MNNIYLVGFMATGKTSVGCLLAKEKNRLENRGLASFGQSHSQSQWQFVDLDDLIEFKEKHRIADIFSKKGEPYFRRVEKQTLKEVSREKNFVLACGGGAVIDPENIRTMKETGIIVCLSAIPEVILKRTSGCVHRPLLNVKEPKKQIELLLKLRAPYYAKADKKIDTSKLSVGQVVKNIIKVTSRKTQVTSKKTKVRAKSKKRVH